MPLHEIFHPLSVLDLLNNICLYFLGHCQVSTLFSNFTETEYVCSGLDLFSYDFELKALRLVETKRSHVSWYVYTHESRLVLLASGMQCKSFIGYQVAT